MASLFNNQIIMNLEEAETTHGDKCFSGNNFLKVINILKEIRKKNKMA